MRKKKRTLGDDNFIEYEGIGTDLILQEGEFLDRKLEVWREEINHPKLGAKAGRMIIDDFLFMIQKQAEDVLREHGKPIDMSELWWMNEIELGEQCAVAKRVLSSIGYVQDAVEINKDPQRIVIEMIPLMANAIRANIFHFAAFGDANYKGRSSGGNTSNWSLGIARAIKFHLDKNINLSVQRLWNKLKEYSSDDCLVVEGFEVFMDVENLTQIDKKTGKISSIVFSTFKKYVSEVKKN